MQEMPETRVPSLRGTLCQEEPPEEEVRLTPVFLPGKFHGQRSLTGYSPWGCKELDTPEHTLSNQIIGVLESAHSGLS